ncbi:sigma 54-interacting transcriptional regulator [bacterium]|nr:sigma 54-interacting transcriptional regulator [bacterium]
MELDDYRILVTEDDQESASRVIGWLSAAGMRVESTGRLPGIKKLSETTEQALIVIITGAVHEPARQAFLQSIKTAPPALGVICLVEPTEPESLSYFDHLLVDEVFEKPVQDNEIVQAVSRLIERKRLIGSTRIIGRTPAMREVIERVAQYSQVNSTVMISGESGTGKELVAQAIHSLSSRRLKPFIAVNCGAIAEGVLESELFGHEKGSFTGATALRKGHFEFAHGGTIFLDEVGEMPLTVQVKLLRVLEEREIMRVGGSQRIRVDVRVVTATNKNLELEVERGAFRRDLYYRLKVLSIHVPSLRERRDDIPLLFDGFIQQFCRENNRTFAGIDEDAQEVLKNYDWPGNVRELRNLAESMVVLSLGSRIRARDIPEQIYRRGRPERLLPVPFGQDSADSGGPHAEGAELRLLYKAVMTMQQELHEIRQLLLGQRRTGRLEDFYGPPPPPAGSSQGLGHANGDISEIGSVQFEEPEEHSSASRRAGSMREIERQAIQRTLDSVDGNRRRAAKVLGIGERTLYRKIREYGL